MTAFDPASRQPAVRRTVVALAAVALALYAGFILLTALSP